MSNELSYSTYLRVDDLLSLQQPRAAGIDADPSTVLSEHFFIVSHQACELWLKQILGDLAAVESTFGSMTGADLERAVDLLYRSAELLRLMREQLVALERLPNEDFASFRQYLGSASGAQSGQFHELERVLGNADRAGTLFLAFSKGLALIGSSVEQVVDAGVEAGSAYRVVEGLLQLGNGFFSWKVGHVGLISKMLGEQRGTAGSSGTAYLVDRATLPFAELRELRGKAHARTPVRTG